MIAVEPSETKRSEEQRLHQSAHIQWLDESLPDFQVTQRLGLSFDVILLSALCIHLSPAGRSHTFRKLMALLKPDGLLAIRLGLVPAPPECTMFELYEHEIETLAKNTSPLIERLVLASDQSGRTEISWVQLAVRLPGEGPGALP